MLHTVQERSVAAAGKAIGQSHLCPICFGITYKFTKKNVKILSDKLWICT